VKLTANRLKSLLEYNPENGVFTRKIDASNTKSGSVAGYIDIDSGYVRIGIDGKRYWAHRLAWLYMHGVWPVHDIDHIDRDRSNNRISNLRDVRRSMNLQNQVEANQRSVSRIRGVSWDKARCRWKVELSVGNRNKYIGRFSSIDAAADAYRKAKEKFHPGAIL
jgi:hypothetical protein